jgi:lipopolysaccharide biosynthesis glycosyltransferase
VAAASIREVTPDVRFHVLQDGLSAANRAAVEASVRGAEVCWIGVHAPALHQLPPKMHWSPATYYRMALPELMPQLSRVLYLDADILVLRDLRELWETDLAGRPVGAVKDEMISRALVAKGRPADYFNSGVMLIDLDLLRASGAMAKARAYMLQHYEGLLIPDQHSLNLALSGQWAELDPIWNVQRQLMDQIADPGVLHFTMPEKPWLTDDGSPHFARYRSALARMRVSEPSR